MQHYHFLGEPNQADIQLFKYLRTLVACSEVLCILNYEDMNVHASHSTGTSEENGHLHVICLRVVLLE